MKVPIVEENLKDRVGVYVEYFIHVFGDKFFLVEFLARPVDVPVYRKEVDAMIQSIRVTGVAGSEPKTSEPKTKVEL